MRFLFYDKVLEVKKGKSIIGMKNFSLSEEYLRRHFSKKAIVPGTILIESMAQLLGWSIIFTHDFKLWAIMSLLENVVVSPMLRPAFHAEIHAEILSTSKQDSLGKAEIIAEGKCIASVQRIIYNHVYHDNPNELKSLFSYYSGKKTEL
jgi:3-hydroxyacyl-[acyl-carrier-protein] dehydratase